MKNNVTKHTLLDNCPKCGSRDIEERGVVLAICENCHHSWGYVPFHTPEGRLGYRVREVTPHEARLI